MCWCDRGNMCVRIVHFVIPADIISHSIGGSCTWNEPRGPSNWKFKWVFPARSLLVCQNKRTCECIYSDLIQILHKKTAMVLSPSCGGLTVKKKRVCDPESYTVLHSLVSMIVSLLWLLSSAQWTDVFIVCVKQRLSADKSLPWHQRIHW